MFPSNRVALIWDRALDLDSLPLPMLEGDAALSDLLLFHGCAMNGGIIHALEHCNSEDLVGMLDDIKAGYRYFGLGAIADLIDEGARRILASPDRTTVDCELNERYAAIVPDDEALVARLHAALEQRPSDFVPV